MKLKENVTLFVLDKENKEINERWRVCVAFQKRQLKRVLCDNVNYDSILTKIDLNVLIFDFMEFLV